MQLWENEALKDLQKGGSYTVTLDDDPLVAKIVEQALGITTKSFSTAKDFSQHYEELDPVGIFVDVHLAEQESGLEILPLIVAKWPDKPVIVITSDSEESLVSHALSAGACDFIRKPIRPGELVSRLLIRLQEINFRLNRTLLRFGDITLDLQHNALEGPGGQVYPSPREVDIIAHLIRFHGAVVDKKSLKHHIWGSISVSDNALDRKLFEVRKAIKGTSQVLELVSVYGRGVALRHKNQDDDQNPQ